MMAELIHMRQRIKTVETIKKITHAMRLVSMSAHAKLNKQYAAIATYQQGITSILSHIMHAAQDTHVQPKVISASPHKLLIVIGSQKGLCGSFNSMLFHALDDYITKTSSKLQIIAVGKKMVDYIQTQYKNISIQSFPHLTPQSASAIAHTITDRIVTTDAYTTVTILSNTQKNFFVQTPRLTPLLPVPISAETMQPSAHAYSWDVNPQELIKHLTRQYVAGTLHKALLESLLAEHAARFVSMDSSTRNAEKILETTRLKYNKLRQAKITKELLELADAF